MSKNTIDLKSKIQPVFKNRAKKDFQKFVKRQASALTLLLKACNWYGSLPSVSHLSALTDRGQQHNQFQAENIT
jgi:hypothetical protein